MTANTLRKTGRPRGTSGPSLSKLAVRWIMCAPPNEIRTQGDAAVKFGIDQSTISRAVRRHVAESIRPDQRKKGG